MEAYRNLKLLCCLPYVYLDIGKRNGFSIAIYHQKPKPASHTQVAIQQIPPISQSRTIWIPILFHQNASMFFNMLRSAIFSFFL